MFALVLTRILAVLVITAVLLVAGGCGGSSDDSSNPDTATEEATAEPVEEPQEESSVRAGALAEIRDDFGLNFAGVSWHTPPETLEIEGSTLVARTDFYPDDQGRDLANRLCNALNGNYVLSNTADYGLDGVTVYAQDDPVASASGGGTC